MAGRTMTAGPLDGLRVLELASGVAGPYAGRLMAMLGATVVKAEPPGGDPARSQWIDDEPPPAPSPLFVHLNAGKRLVSAAAGHEAVSAGWPHVVLDDRVRSAVSDPIDAPVVVHVTAWGYDAEEPGTIDDE